MSARKLSLGQTLWFVPSDRRDVGGSQLVTVEKIGRVWATLSNQCRIDLTDWCADGKGYQSPGRAWESREAWQAETDRRALWNDTCDKMRYARCPLTLEQIQQIREWWGLPAALSKATGAV